MRDSARHRRLLRGGTLALALLVLVTGALSAYYHRPAGRGGVWRLGFDLVFTRGLELVHTFAAHAIVVVGALWVATARPWRRGRGWRIGIAGGVLAAMLFLVTGHLIPWPDLLPWAERPGGNLRSSAALTGQEGPFPELVGVRLEYGDSMFTVASRHFGALAVKRLFRAHVYWLPGLVLVATALLLRRQASPRASIATSAEAAADAPTTAPEATQGTVK